MSELREWPLNPKRVEPPAGGRLCTEAEEQGLWLGAPRRLWELRWLTDEELLRGVSQTRDRGDLRGLNRRASRLLRNSSLGSTR